MTERLEKGALSRDVQLMYLGDVNAAPTIANGNGLVFNEATEKFIPAAILDTGTLIEGNTAGDIVGAFEAFDLSGTSLGYVMVYDAITSV